MFFSNAVVFFADKGFVPSSFRVEDGVYTDFLPSDTDEAGAVNLGGSIVIPGLIDIHTHGNSGADFSDGDYERLKTMAAYLARCDVTGFAPTSMTLAYDALDQAYATAKQLCGEKPANCARLLGINMEGPFFRGKERRAECRLSPQSRL